MNAKELTLRIVPLSDVVLHEKVELRRVENLVEHLRADRFLKNPPIVAQFDSKYVVLDGATRVTALEKIGCRDAAVQVVDYDAPDIILETWNHMLLDSGLQTLFEAWGRLPGLRIEATALDNALQSLDQRESIAAVLLADGQVFAMGAKDEALEQQARLLNRVVEAYEGSGELYRVAHTDVERLLAEHGRLSALIVFPRYRRDEIRKLALGGSKLPMGVTRHIIPGRALRINCPLEILESERPLGEKNAWLDQWIQDKMLERHIRYYQEPVFLFDE
ncbi:MAG: hypothetical protein M1132_02955 [Chloroflexi bacterium]|nr:hypothetical protein [Chloroflexota bacterium]